MSMIRTRWAAVGAAVAVSLGAGGLTFVDAAKDSGDRPVTVTIEPCRLRDTRPDRGIGGRTAPLGATEEYIVQATGTSGNCDIPSDATGLVLNVTADQATEATNLRLYPTGATIPTTSNLNPRPGAAPTPNAVTVGLSPAGQFTIRNANGNVHVIIDVAAYLVPHNHDDEATRIGHSSASANFVNLPGGNTADDVATLEITAPPGRRTITLVTAVVYVNTSGDQQSTWVLEQSTNGAPRTTASDRILSVVDPSGTTNPSDTITMTTQIVQEPGDVTEVSVSGERVAGVPLANIRVELSSVTAALDASGNPPSAG
jgi:hypothetical protein